MLISRFGYICLVGAVSVLSACDSDQSAAPDTGTSVASGDVTAVSGVNDLLATADIKRGQTLYFQCRACHSLKEGESNKVGPNLYGMFERKAGLAPDFVYSEALASSDVVWTAETVDDWLARPSKFLPGNRMVFVGVKDAQDRANLIAYLLEQTGTQ